MKNTIQLLLIILSLFFFASCSQAEFEQDNKPISPIYEGKVELQLGSAISPYEMSLEDGRINFHSFEAFEKLAANTSDQSFVAHFKSMVHGKGEYHPDPSAENYVQNRTDDYLKGFLFNSDGIFQLKDLIFKVNVKEQSLRFLSASKQEQLNAFINQSDASDIGSVSVQDILGLDGENTSGPLPVSCWMCIVGTIATQRGDIGGAIVTRTACALCKIQLGDDGDEDQHQ
ncbi:MAG: hypothetical protein AAFR87_17940 [Bacteroidota bacterium]